MGTKKGINLNEKNGQWKGDAVSLEALHAWVHRRLPKPLLCMECKLAPPYDLANKSQHYLRNISDWEWLCRKCHMTKDGRVLLVLKNIQNSQQPGVDNPRSKLSLAQIQEIRNKYKARPKDRGKYQQALAAEYNVHPSTISRIVLYKTYK